MGEREKVGVCVCSVCVFENAYLENDTLPHIYIHTYIHAYIYIIHKHM